MSTCSHCGTHLDIPGVPGLCPACLMAEGVKPPDPDPLRSALQERLRGQYHIVRLLGRGGMGAVYLARDLTLEREVAIKVMRATADDPARLERLRREARTAARLTHPNVVPLHAFGVVEGMPYFVMGYVRGESLAALLRREGRLPEEAARRVLGDVADALDHAHRQGVIHRDVKPDNVLLDDETGRALLADFGVARALDGGETLAGEGQLVGTPHFMSPEQASGSAQVDARTDLYALGVMGFAMLAGRLPFEGATAADVVRARLASDPPPLRGLAPGVSHPTIEVVERCLARDPTARWPDARAIRHALGHEESSLPDVLRSLEGSGVPTAMVMGTSFFLISMSAAPPGVKAVTAVVFGLVFAYAVLEPRSEGVTVRQAMAAIWREPTWWLSWYPRRGRRPGNVWDRLPPEVRRFRAWGSAFGAFFSVFILVFSILHLWHGPRVPGEVQARIFQPLRLSALGGILGFLVVGAWLRMRAAQVLRRHLSGGDLFRALVSVPPSQLGFWARPHIEALLTAPDRDEEGAAPASPHGELQAILRLADGLSGAARPLGAQAAAAARQLLTAVEEAEQEVGELSRNVEPGEAARLESRLAALGPGAEAERLRVLLGKQLELVRELETRLDDAVARRNRRREQLHVLRLHLASVRARSAEATSVTTLSDEVRRLCEEIAEHTSNALPPGSDRALTRTRVGPDSA